MNRLMYDTCATQDSFVRSMAPVSYMLDVTKYERCQPCMPSAGIAGGNNVSTIQSVDRVAIENDLMGRVRPATHCPTYYYKPDQSVVSQGVEYIKPVTYPRIDNSSMQNLQGCPAFFDRPALPPVPPINVQNACGR